MQAWNFEGLGTRLNFKILLPIILNREKDHLTVFAFTVLLIVYLIEIWVLISQDPFHLRHPSLAFTKNEVEVPILNLLKLYIDNEIHILESIKENNCTVRGWAKIWN